MFQSNPTAPVRLDVDRCVMLQRPAGHVRKRGSTCGLDGVAEFDCILSFTPALAAQEMAGRGLGVAGPKGKGLKGPAREAAEATPWRHGIGSERNESAEETPVIFTEHRRTASHLHPLFSMQNISRIRAACLDVFL